ncbi:hypothetical protein HJC23_003398 [Cyclotella cryptica]|uniref:Uncharacterized protein n=1 Tax=Cyclotella cryptica TaxID=29204 RepID=A0ABD3QRY8_9STRA|eukprot:CCRYP_002523-RA/>CCRYP_002523-RA protein AED:0.21 eAED:0.21 QI:164/-1/1/1/-1/1/1/225/241
MSASHFVESVRSSDLNTAMVLRYPGPSSFDHNSSSAFETTLPIVPAYSKAATCYPGFSGGPPPIPIPIQRLNQPVLIASISAGFEKGDFLVREEKGSNIYFDFFEEAFNFICQKGYAQMPKHEEDDYMEVIKRAHRSVPGGCRFNTGRLLMVLKKNLIPVKVSSEDDEEPAGPIMEDGSLSYSKDSNLSSRKRKTNRRIKNKLAQSTNTLPTASDSSDSGPSHVPSSTYSSASTSYADSWE